MVSGEQSSRIERKIGDDRKWKRKKEKKYSYSTYYPLLPELSGDPLFQISGIVSYSAKRKYHIILSQTVWTLTPRHESKERM